MVFSIIPLRNHSTNEIISANYWDLTSAIKENSIKREKSGRTVEWIDKIGESGKKVPEYNSWETVFNPSISHLYGDTYLVAYRAYSRNIFNNTQQGRSTIGQNKKTIHPYFDPRHPWFSGGEPPISDFEPNFGSEIANEINKGKDIGGTRITKNNRVVNAPKFAVILIVILNLLIIIILHGIEILQNFMNIFLNGVTIFGILQWMVLIHIQKK